MLKQMSHSMQKQLTPILLIMLRGGTQKNKIFSWAIDLFKELQKIH